MGVPTDPAFWGPAFTFLTAVVGASRWLLKVTFVYRQRAAKLDSENEKLKDDHLQKTVIAIKGIIDQLVPVVEIHTKRLEELKNIYDESLQMMKELKIQYAEFHSRIDKAQAGGSLVMKKMEEIETEIINLRNGNILVRTKK